MNENFVSPFNRRAGKFENYTDKEARQRELLEDGESRVRTLLNQLLFVEQEKEGRAERSIRRADELSAGEKIQFDHLKSVLDEIVRLWDKEEKVRTSKFEPAAIHNAVSEIYKDIENQLDRSAIGWPHREL